VLSKCWKNLLRSASTRIFVISDRQTISSLKKRAENNVDADRRVHERAWRVHPQVWHRTSAYDEETAMSVTESSGRALYCIALYNVLTPARNAVDSSIHGINKDHTDTWKNTKIYLSSVSECGSIRKAYCTLNGASTIALTSTDTWH